MKSLSFKLGVILIGIVFFGCGEVWSADWRLYSVDDLGRYYYDAEGITHSSKNIVKIWLKVEFIDKGVIYMIKKLGEKFENLEHSISLHEINCSDKKMRILSSVFYSKEGETIYKISREDKWEYIVPGTAGEALYKGLCK